LSNAIVFPAVVAPYSEHVRAFRQDKKPSALNLFSYAFRVQEWSEQTTSDVLRLRKSPPLVSFFVCWLFALLSVSHLLHLGDNCQLSVGQSAFNFA
jgi:hypothetical protein